MEGDGERGNDRKEVLQMSQHAQEPPRSVPGFLLDGGVVT